MSQIYRESIDGRGRTVIVLENDLSTVLMVCGALGFAPLFLFGWESAPFVLANLMIFGALAGWFRYTRRRMRVMIDPEERTIAFGSRVRAREFAFGDVVRAQLNSQHAAGMPGHSGGEQRQAHRVDLVLASGEVVPLMQGYAAFSADECQRMVERINRALGK